MFFDALPHNARNVCALVCVCVSAEACPSRRSLRNEQTSGYVIYVPNALISKSAVIQGEQRGGGVLCLP